MNERSGSTVMRDASGHDMDGRIGREMYDFRPDVVHAVNPVWLAAYGVLSARRRDLPLLAFTPVPEVRDQLDPSILERQLQDGKPKPAH